MDRHEGLTERGREERPGNQARWHVGLSANSIAMVLLEPVRSLFLREYSR